MTWIVRCKMCKKDFEHDLVFGDEFECPHCHSILSTDMDGFRATRVTEVNIPGKPGRRPIRRLIDEIHTRKVR